MGPRGTWSCLLPLFLPTLEGLSPVVRAHLGRDQGPPLFDWHPQILTHSHLHLNLQYRMTSYITYLGTWVPQVNMYSCIP